MVSDKKSIRVITFDGKHSNYHPWSVKFLARARRKGFAELFLLTAVIPKESEVDALPASSSADDEKLVSNYDKAIIGYYDELTLSIDTEKPSGKVAFSLVESSTSPDYPNGHYTMAWKALKKKYQPEMVTELTTLETVHNSMQVH